LGVRISLTGRVSIEANGARVDERSFPGRQGRLVFAYLLAEEGRAVPRDELAELLWGEAPPARWEKALSVLVSKLRALLEGCGVDGQVALRSAFGCYQLALPPGVWIDVAAAREAADRAEVALGAGDVRVAGEAAAEAAALSRRSFLPGEDGPWIEEKRRELSELLVRALECLAEASLAAGEAREAVRHAEELTALEPYRESGYRWLMEAHVAVGNPAEALRVYERCRRFLADELGAYPSQETEAAYLKVLRAENATDEPVDAGVQQSPEPRPQRRRTALLIAVGVLLAAGVALVAGALSSGGDALPAKFHALGFQGCSSVRYGGAGSPELLIVADLPLHPEVRAITTPMVNAMELALEKHSYRAGTHRVALQVCDDSIQGNTVPVYDEATCRANARHYAANASVIGVVGPFTSTCAKLEVPILNRAPGGPVAVVSPSNTDVGLTKPPLHAVKDEPAIYHPTGQRNYARVIPADDIQAAADALAARSLGVKRVYVLYPREYEVPLVRDFVRATIRLRIPIPGHGSWQPGQKSYARLADRIARTGADGVFIAGGSDPGSIRLLRDLRARLGPGAQFLTSSDFDPPDALLASAGAQGMTISQPGPLGEHLSTAGKRYAASFSKKFGTEPTSFALSSAQAMDVLLDAIARSDGTRASVRRRLFDTRVTNGILGSFWITPTGDTSLNAITIQRVVGGKLTTYATIVVPDTLVASR
jgi:DNA-binding SARP family transcriptional activator/ABC-type branched-subunit amino acid transport system substrate-binding protein